MSEEKGSMVAKLNDAIGDFFGSLLGDNARKVFDDARETAEDISRWVGSKSVELVDDLLERLELIENENFKKVRDGYEDTLRELGLLEEGESPKKKVGRPPAKK